MTDEQLDEIDRELDREIENVLLEHFAYVDLGNSAIPEAIHNAKEDIIKMVEDIMEKIRG